MASGDRRWQVDWAGPHGTAWGTVNACLTVLSAACAGRLVQTHWPVPTTRMVVAAVVTTTAGVIFALLRAALRRKPTPGATLVYKICCWAGAGAWVTFMYRTPDWTWRYFAQMVGALIILAVVAGLLAALAADDPPAEPQVGTPAADGQETPTSSDPEQAARDAKAIEWEKRLIRLTGVDGIAVPNVEPWERGNGYSVEAVLPEGGHSWQTIAGKQEEIAADLDLVAGCRISVQMGASRRIAVVDVMDVSTLHEEKPYPAEYGPLSILDPLPGAVRDDDTEIGPDLRSKCMLLVGETGSGKTNAGNVIGVGVIRTVDALLWDLDFTGGLFRDLLHPHLQGKVKQPAVDWAAWDEREAILMTRAAIRGHVARKTGYGDLMREANDDKVPVSDALPEVVIRADEIAPITGAPSKYPDLNENISAIVFEGRAAAFRMVLLGLRATADIVGTDIQAQCHVIAVTRAKSDAEYAWAFGWHSGAKVEDAPYPGCGFISLESGARPVAQKWRRVRPQQLVEAAIAVDGRQPEMDELTRLALDGRNPDGTPMDGLMPGELDCYSTRWDRFRAKYGGSEPATATETQPSTSPSAPATTSGGASPAQAIADIQRVFADLEKHVAEKRAQRGNDEQVDADFQAILAAEGFGPDVDWGDPDNWANLPESAPRPDDEERLLALIREAGQAGARPRDLLAQLRERHQIVISRDTLHERLRQLKDAGRVRQPSHGKWAAQP